MAIWNGLTEEGAVVPIQVDGQGRVVVSGGGGVPSQVIGNFKAYGIFGSNGVTEESINLSCSFSSTGRFQLTFDTPMASNLYVPLYINMETKGMIPQVYELTTQGFKLLLTAFDGTLNNARMGIVVFDATPTSVTPLILPSSLVDDVERLKEAVGLDDP